MNAIAFCGALSAAILCAASPSLAEPVKLSEMTLGYTYFNRAGADVPMHDKAVAGCALEATKTRSMDQMTQPMLGILGAVIGSALADAYNRSTVASGLENCMVVRGWRVVRLPDAEGKALAALDQAVLSAKLAPWIGQSQPNGEVVRTWGNDLANAGPERFTIRPSKTVNGQLSLKAVAPDVTVTPPLAPTPLQAAVKIDPIWPKKAIKPADTAKVPPGGGVILFHLRGMTMKDGVGVLLNRMGPDLATAPSVTDKGPDVIMAAVGMIHAKKDGNMMAFAVPAGRWRIATFGLMPSISTCLGAPGFEMNAGEVVYAGSLNLLNMEDGPDMDLALAKAWLGAQPAAEQVRPAVWINGLEGVCGNNAIYALEFKGAPFEPGYAAGSLANAAP